MARIFITGSTTGLGLLAGQKLLDAGHEPVFHARNAVRAAELRRAEPRVGHVVVGDISTIGGARDVAQQVNALGPMEGVIHNAGVAYGGGRRQTADDLPEIFAVNVLAPYVLTSLIARPARLVYLSSGMHRTTPHIDDALWQQRSWNGTQAYSESKLYVTAMVLAFAKAWPDTRVNAVDPGWVPTRMGGAGAPDDLQAGAESQAALVRPDSSLAQETGGYFHHMVRLQPSKAAQQVDLQVVVLDLCRKLSDIDWREGADR